MNRNPVVSTILARLLRSNLVVRANGPDIPALFSTGTFGVQNGGENAGIQHLLPPSQSNVSIARSALLLLASNRSCS